MKLILAALPLFSFVLWSQPSTPAGYVTVRFGNNPERTFTEEDLIKMPRHHLSANEHGARDGYAVVYALTEMDAAFTDSGILLTDRAKGQPLSEAQEPFRIVVPSDKKPARSLRMLERIDVIRLRK
jgi:hypothetical protein